jgi:threonylcarbamoyladenosine tRNA methylthiotransferase MtaB
MELSARKHRLFIESQLGKTLHVLFEHKSHNGLMYGWTENYVRVKIPYDKNLDNKIYSFELQTLDTDGVVLGQIK